MKTKILSIATILFVVFSISSKSFAVSNNNDVTTTLTDMSNINKIEVHGNVQLFISNGVSDKVKVYDSYYSQNALVQEQNGVLRISSYKAEKLVVWVTVADLRGISAYDNATVESFGKFSGLDFNLSLNNNASASFDMDCAEANIALNDDAKANISGMASESSIVVNQAATLNSTQFYAERLTQKRITPVVTAKVEADELALN
ncbi:hypothetical protein BDD43_3282 [Mucilaginibacter gracilis]|uniref:Putative auto-transporter adhesin head GIN domain-containing protein n=1 Tax=Mucilaginibacter gracilis TaxID=423350 RepID=A0A495J324_9SPHI|nr:DUF2807 domain-containing protein [Mucilaginibacter gracilis]RKR83081.1 hypothetical protein BDD43_3282 [Mucilaginibacter gracilis]